MNVGIIFLHVHVRDHQLLKKFANFADGSAKPTDPDPTPFKRVRKTSATSLVQLVQLTLRTLCGHLQDRPKPPISPAQ